MLNKQKSQLTKGKRSNNNYKTNKQITNLLIRPLQLTNQGQTISQAINIKQTQNTSHPSSPTYQEQTLDIKQKKRANNNYETNRPK